MDNARVARGDETGERGIIELNGGALLIPSFTDAEKSYKVHPDSGYCSCKRFTYTGKCEKHIVLAEAVQEARALKFGSFVAEEAVVELCHRLFRPLKNEHPMDSYRVLLDTFGCRYATERMEKAAARRHGRNLLLHDPERGAA